MVLAPYLAEFRSAGGMGREKHMEARYDDDGCSEGSNGSHQSSSRGAGGDLGLGLNEESGNFLVDLRDQIAQITQEVLMQRKEVCEIRDAMGELLQNREPLLQCLELRESMKAFLAQGYQGLSGDKTAEIDQTLAAVSDNTARHGMAISTLTEQQRRTTSAMEAVVRAVKRLGARSRSRGSSAAAGGGVGGAERGYGHSVDGWGTHVAHGGYGVMHNSVGSSYDSLSCGGGGPGRDVGDAGEGAAGGDDLGDVGGDAPAPSNGGASARYRGADGHHSSSARTSGRRSRRPASVGRYHPQGGFTGTASCEQRLDFPSDGRYDRPSPREQQGGGADPLGGSADVAQCVTGVLARIEEALTKLDGPGSLHDGSGSLGGRGHRDANLPVSSSAPDYWGAATDCVGSGGVGVYGGSGYRINTEGAIGRSTGGGRVHGRRPHSACTSRGGGATNFAIPRYHAYKSRGGTPARSSHSQRGPPHGGTMSPRYEGGDPMHGYAPWHFADNLG